MKETRRWNDPTALIIITFISLSSLRYTYTLPSSVNLQFYPTTNFLMCLRFCWWYMQGIDWLAICSKKKEVKNPAIISTYICCSHSLVQTHLLLSLWITSKLRIITACRLLWSSSMILLFWSDETTEVRECLLVWWTCQQLEWNSAGTNASHAGNSSRVTPPLVERPQRWLHVITWNIYFFLSVKHCGYRVTCLFSCGLHFENP